MVANLRKSEVHLAMSAHATPPSAPLISLFRNGAHFRNLSNLRLIGRDQQQGDRSVWSALARVELGLNQYFIPALWSIEGHGEPFDVEFRAAANFGNSLMLTMISKTVP